MHIVYAVSTCSNDIYQQLYRDASVKPAIQSQKYHKLLIEGFADYTQVDVIAYPPIYGSVLKKFCIRFSKEKDGNARYHYIPVVRNSLLRKLVVGFETFFRTCCLCRKDSAVVVDCLNVVASVSALAAAKLRGSSCVGIVTDLPEMQKMGKVMLWISNYVIRNCSHYVFLSEPMNTRLNKAGKPYVVLEGHADIQMSQVASDLSLKHKPRVLLYAGGIKKEYGIEMLVKGFRKANLANTQLHIYGGGSYASELGKLAEQDENLFFGGEVLNTEILEKELEATLLINPRPTHEEFVRYSFPSKNMEYMASGTPVLTTVLPGMPKEYYPYVYLLEQETVDGIAEKLTQVLLQTDEELFEKGRAAKEFILNTRNNVVQAGKILKMLEK